MGASGIEFALERFTTFGDLLRFLRRRAGLTQRELSIAVGYSEAQISRLEQNERMPDPATIGARFIPVLMLERAPEVAERLLELAASVRREDAPAAGLPPYKGLYCFDEADAEIFFGREELTATLVARVFALMDAQDRFLALIGASGSGKSSLVRAGLIPALRWQHPSSGWPVFLFTPGAHPLDALEATLAGQDASPRSPAVPVVRPIRRPGDFPQMLSGRATASGAGHALLVVDQFEELFTLCHNADEQSTFVQALLATASQEEGKPLLLVVMRADFYAHCAPFDELREAMAGSQEYIGPMTGTELRQAIESPAERGRWELEPGLVDVMIRDVGGEQGRSPEPGALPLLSHALLETWKRRRGRLLTLSGYSAAGGVRGAIAETAEAVFRDQLDPQERALAKRIFLRLTELGGNDGAADTRRRVSFDELLSKPEEREATHRVLVTLANARLITTEQSSAEVAHEALIREWPTLRRWLEEDREGLRLHRHLTETARHWQAEGRDPGSLYRGVRLAQALEWYESHPAEPNAMEHAFLEASRDFAEKEQEEREAQRERELEAARKLANTERVRAEEQVAFSKRMGRRATFLTMALVAVVVLAMGVAVLLRNATQQSRLANSRQLAAVAVNNIVFDSERSVLLSLQALGFADTLDARNALRQSLPAHHLLHSVQAHRQAPGAAYSPDGAKIASIEFFGGEIKIWDAATLELLFALPGTPGSFGLDVAFSPDSKRVAATTMSQLQLWDLTGREQVFALEGGLVEGVGTNMQVKLAFSPDGRSLAVASFDGLPRVFDIATRHAALSLEGHSSLCEGIAYSPDGRLLATSDWAGIIKLWDAQTGEDLRTLEHPGFVHSLAFSPDGGRLASVSESGTLKIWDVLSGRELLRLQGGMSGIYDVAFTPDGRGLATAGKDGSVRLRDVDFGLEYLTLSSSTSTVISLSISPDGRRIVSSGYDGTLKVWDATPGRELLALAAHDDIAWDVAYNPDGSILASAGQDGALRLWDSATGLLRLTIPADGATRYPLSSLGFSPDGRHLAAGGLEGDTFVYGVESGRLFKRMSGHGAAVVSLAFSPDGGQLASASWDGTARVWDLARGETRLTITGPWFGIAFSPDGKSLYAADLDQSVHEWDVATGANAREFPNEGNDVYAVAISPDGKVLAMSGQDGGVTLWDLLSGRKLRKIQAHEGLVGRVAFNREGTRLATGGFDRLAKIWDVATGQELATLYGNTGDVYGVSLNPEGTRLATAAADGMVRTFTLDFEELLGLARSRLTRSLTTEECERYLQEPVCPSAPFAWP